MRLWAGDGEQWGVAVMTYFFGSLLAAALDLRVLAIVALFVFVVPKPIWGASIAAVVSAAMLFYSRNEMASVLNIAAPTVSTFGFDVLRVFLIALIPAGVKSVIQRRKVTR
jgi:hypothetical protein